MDYDPNQSNYYAPPTSPAPPAPNTLVFGILSLCFCWFFLGIIFGAVALSKAKGYVAMGYPLTGKAKVGKILGMVGMIISIVATAYILLVVVGVAALLS